MNRKLNMSKTLAFALLLVCATTLSAEDRIAKSKVPPIYPPAAKTLRIGGIVKVSVTISPEGNVTKADAAGANKLLSGAAIDAVKKWKFAPASSETTQDVEIVFKVAGED